MHRWTKKSIMQTRASDKKSRSFYRDGQPESARHGSGSFPGFVDEMVVESGGARNDFLGHADGPEVVAIQHAEQVDRGHVEELGPFVEEQNADFQRWGGIGGHDCFFDLVSSLWSGKRNVEDEVEN